jgi:hypothetical protein
MSRVDHGLVGEVWSCAEPVDLLPTLNDLVASNLAGRLC